MFNQRERKCLATVSMVIATAVGAATATHGQAPSKGVAKAKAEKLLDLNSATAKELEDSLPGVGEATAKKIVAGRPYTSVDDLSRAGVPARTINGIRALVTVGRAPAASKAAATLAPATPVNLNSATAAELESLPGIGPAHAKAIVEGRPYASVDDLERVKGLGKSRVEALRAHVTVARPAPAVAPAGVVTRKVARPAAKPSTAAAKPALGRPVNLNTATKPELDALPGIGPVKAQAIIDGRPYQKIEDVMKVKGIKEGEFSKIKDMIVVQ